ncbi:pyridoxal-dependent decarboxylase [Streptomyces sp. NPDC046275]|uniref:pyridoxal-dependent decarboxylase n=1 Tax=Streptomyces sp. NPDC046275 TaxID=3157201 RepID=UPI0033E50B36
MSPRTALTPPDEALAIGFQPSPPEADTRAMRQLQRAFAPGDRPFLGFPDHLGQVMDALAPLLGLFTHQQGGPYDDSRFDDGVRAYEKAVLTYFATLAGVCLDEAHGYVAASAREALLHGLVMARRGLPEPSVYVSEQAHYDVVRACELLGMNTVRIRALGDGAMDPDDLRLQVRMRRGAGALVVATCGTPLHGAIDDVAELRATAAAFGPVHVHVDASAGGLAAAHTDRVASWSLAHGAHSITLSGHPLLGLPVPAGVSLVRRAQGPHTNLPITLPDRLLVGARSGLSALLLWARLRSLGQAGVAAMVARSQEVAAYALATFEAAGVAPERFPGSLTVTFERPARWVIDKWRLHYSGDRARVVTTGPMTYTAVDELAADLSAARQEVAA